MLPPTVPVENDESLDSASAYGRNTQRLSGGLDHVSRPGLSSISSSSRGVIPTREETASLSTVSVPRNFDEPRYNLLGGAKSLTAEQIKNLDGGDELLKLVARQERGTRGFGEAITDFNAGDLPVVGDVVDTFMPISEMFKVADTVKAVDSGKQVSDQDALYAQLYLTQNERMAQRSTSGMVGDALRTMPGFMSEIYMYAKIGARVGAATETPHGAVAGAAAGAVVGAGKAAVRVGARAVTGIMMREGAKEAAAKWSKKLVANVAGRSATRKFGRGMLEGAVKATGLQLADTALNATYNIAAGNDIFSSKQAADRYVGGNLSGDDISMAHAKLMALGDHWIEYVSEMSGGAIGDALLPNGGTMAWLGKRIDKEYGPGTAAAVKAKAQAYTGIKLLASKMTADGDPKTMFKWLKNVGYDGYFEEMLEERYGDAARGLFGLQGDEDEGRIKNMIKQAVPDKQQFMTEAISFAVPIVTALSAAKGHRWLAGQDTPEITKHLGNVLMGTKELVTPHVERLGDEISSGGGKTANGVTLGDAVDSIAFLADANEQRPTGPFSRILDTALSLAEVVTSGSFAPLIRHSNIGQVLARYGREDFASRYTEIKHTLKAMAKQSPAYKGLSEAEVDAKVTALAKDYLTEVVGVARKSLVLKESALDKAVDYVDADNKEAAKQEIVKDLQARFDGKEPTLAIIPYGSGRHYHEIIVDNDRGHPISETVSRINKAADEVLFRHGIDVRRKFVNNANELTIQSMMGPEISLDEVNELKADPNSFKASMLSGELNIDPSTAGGAARLNKVLDRHTGLHASGAYGQGIYEKYDQSGTVLTSRVGYETLPDGRVYFTPKYDNSGTDADRKARLNQSESDARMLNSQLSGVDVSTDPFDIDVRMQGYKFTKDTTPPSLKFSRNVWMANQDPKVLTSAYGYTATNDADAERYIREVLFGGKMEDGVYVVGAGNLNDENQVSVRASANLYHTWEELTEHALKLWNKAERGEVYAFEAPIENFMDEVRQLVIAKLKADDGTADLLQERAFLAMLNKSDTDAPVKLFGQLFLGYNDPMTRLVVKEVIAFSEQIESLRSDLLDNPSATTAEFAKYMGFVTKLLTKRGTLDTNQFELQVNPYLSAESKDALATQLTTVANTKATEAPAPAKTEKKAPAPVSSKPVETQSPATAKPVAEKKPVVAKEPVAEEPPVAKKPVEEKPIVSQETPIKSRVANLPPPPGAAKATAPVAEAVKPEAVVAKAPVAEAVKPEVPTQEVVHSTVVGLPPAPESSEAKPKKKKHVLNVGKFKSTLSTEAIDSSLTPESTVKGAVGTPPDFFFPLNPDEFFSDGQVKSLSEQHAIISNFNDVIRDSMARIIDPSYDANLTPEAYVKRAENSDTEALNSDSSVKDTDMFDYSDSELSTMQDGNTRTLKVFKGVRNLAESIQLITGLDGYQSILELTHGTDTLPRLLEAASSDEALVSWMDSVAANETTAETALKSIVRYVNGLAAANDKDTGFTATHMADMVESMRVMYPLEANEGTLTINAASIERGSIGDFELKVKNRVNVEAKLHTLANARIATFNIDPAKSGKELRSKFEALMTMPGFQTREAGTANADRIAKLLSVDKSEFKTALFKFLHDFTGAPTAFFATASRKPEGRAVIASIVASPLSFWFAANSVNTNNIGSYKFMSSPNEATRKKAFEKAIKDTWLGVAEATGSLVPTNVAARPNVLKIMKLADVTDGAFAPIYKDGNLKGQAGCVSRDKFVRYVDAFLKAVGSPLTISTGGMSLFKGLTIKSDEMTHPRYVEFGNLEAPDMRLVLQQMFEQGWMYTGVYGDKTNDRFIKMPSITVEQAAKEYRALYERPSNTLLDQSVWISPETIDKMVEEYKVLKEKDDAKKASNADIRRMNAIKHEVKRVRFVTEFDRIVDGDMRFYAPKLKKGTKIPEFLLKTVAENGGSITSEQRSDPLVDRIAGDLLVSRTKRRGNDLTGGRDLSSIERYMAEIPGRKNGKIRVAVINSNFGLGDFTDGMGVFLESTVGTSFVKAEGVDFAGSEDSAHTFKPQISGTYAVGDARVPLLDKLNLVGIEQLAADPDRADAAKILKFMQEAEVDVIVFDSAEKVPSGPAYALGFLKDDRLAITSIDDLAKVKILNKTREITREVSGADFTLPLALHGDTEPSEARFAKQLQHLVWSSPNGVSYRKLIDQYIEKVAAGVQTSNMDFLTKLAIKQLKTGDDESVRLANALKTGQLSIVSPSIRSRVNLLQAVLKSMRFSVARARGPLVMRFDKPDSGRMTRPGLDNPYKLINANIDDPNVHYVTNLAATTEDAAKTAFAKLFMREFRTKNPRAFETKQTVRRGTAEDQIAAAFDDMLSTAEQVPVANAESVVVPYRYAFNIAREERPAEANELSSKVVDGVRMIAPGDALVSFNEDGSLNTDSLRKNIIQAGADGNYILLGTGFIPDRIPADGITSASVGFLYHGFASSEVNLIELDANTVTYMGADGDGDSPNLWMIGELMDDSPEGLKNRMLSLIFDDYLTDPSIIDWSKRGIDTLHTNIITPTGEMLKYGPNAPVNAVTYANILDRVSYEWLVGQAGKDNVGTAAKINSTSMALSATGVYLQETTTLVTPNGTFVIEHTAEDAAGILDTTDSTLWNRFRMAMHVAPQMGVSRAVDDAKAFIMGHMKLSSWRMAIELAGTLFNKAILHPAGEVDASGKPTKFNYEAEFPAAAKQSIDMTVAVAKSKYLDAVDEFMVRRAGSELSPSFKRQDVRQSMVTVAARSFLSADETAAMKKALAGLPELKPAWYEARSEFVTNNTAIGAWIKLHDIGESIREFGSVADTMVVATPVKTLETFERAAETVANIKANGGLGSIKVLHPEYLSIADTIISKLQDAMPFAHPASSTLGMFVREAVRTITKENIPAVKVDSAIGTLMSQNALKTMIDGLGEDLDTKFPVERVRSLRTEYPDFFNLVAPSGQFIDALELVPVYAGDSGVVLPDALITKARASFDAMPVKLQLEVAAAALSIYDIQTSARQHSFTMLLGNPEKSKFVREFTAAIRTEFNKLSTTDSADRVLDLLTGRPSVARARVAQSTLGTEYKKYEKAAKAYADAEDVAPMNRSAVDAVAKAPETVVEKAPESKIPALVKEARPPAMFAFKELAKANRAEYVLAPTTGDAKSFAVRLGAAAERADKLVSEDTTDSRIYVSLPGSGRIGAADALAAAKESIPSLLDWNNTLITDNEDNATRAHNASGEGELRKFLQSLGAKETSFPTHSEWTKAPVQATTTDEDFKAKLDSGKLTKNDITPNVVVVVGTRHSPEGVGYGGSDALAVELGVKDPVGNGRLGTNVFGIETESKPGDPNSFDIVKLPFGNKAPVGVFDGHRSGKMNVTNAAPGTPGALGNPFVSDDVAGGKYTRAEATRLFEQAFLNRVNNDPAYREWVLSLRGSKVGYYKPSEASIHLQAVQKWLIAQTDTSRLETMSQGFKQLYAEAAANPGTTFLLTKVGTLRAGYTEAQIIGLLPDNMPSNIVTPTGWEKYAEATANPIEKIQETPVSEQLVSVPHQKAVSLTDVSSPFVSVGKDGYPVDVMLDEGGVWTAYRLGHMDVLTDEQVIAYWNRASESGITKVEAPSEYTPTYEAKGNTYSSGVPVSDDIRFMRNDYITPTVEQGEALLKIAEFLDTGSESMAELVGYAGTGKTTLIENIIGYASKDRKVFVWAPTNVAVKIIEGKLKNGHGYGKATLSTIHSGLFGEPDKSGNWVVQNGIKDNALVIIDESSMIDKEVFLAIRKSVLDARNSKVLFIGDNYQLEPVGAPSNVLSEQASPVSSKYRTKLSGVLRQAADSPVLTAATQTRINDAPMVPNKSVAKFVVHTGASDFLKAYIAALKSERTDVMMIASTNSERIRYNELARRILHPESAQSTLVVGDLITSTANSEDMVNSETGTITDPGVITGIHTIKILDKLGKATTVSFERRSGVYITSGDSKIEAVVYLAPKLTMASLPHSQVFKSFTPADLQSDINEDIVTNKKGEQSLGKHVILATYAYARTGHKAQGSQAPHVFVDQSFSHKDWNAGRWYYTAITRSSDKIDLLLNPSIHKRFDLEKAQAELKQVAPKFLSRPITGLEKNAVSEEQLTRYSDPDWATREPITDQYDLPRMFTSSDDNGNKVIIDKDEVGSWMLFNESTPDGIYIKTADAISFWNKVIPTESTTLSTNAIEPARKFGDVPSYSSFTKAHDLVSAWLDSRAEDLAKEDDPKLVASNRARLATYWDKALAPFSKAQTYEEAAAAISDLDATLYGMNPRIQESMRQWALSHLPMVSAIEELDYSVVARDTVPHLKTLDPDQVDTDSEYTPGSVTLSTYPVISRFEDVLSPYRGTGASKLTNILVDEGNAMDAALGRVNRYYERTAVEWGLTGIVNRYEEHTFSIDETGKKGSYTMIGRALMDKKNADKLTDDEKKLNALIQYMAFMGLEHTKLVAGKRVFNRAEASKVYAILAPEYSADLETLKRSLPDALAEKVYARMQKALEGLELPTEEDDDLERADKERKIALAVKAAKVGTFQRVPIWSSHRGYSATDVSKNWKARKISYYVSLEDLETEMKASETNTTGNQLIAKLLKNHRAKTRLTIDTLVNESANELDTLQKFVNERAPWVMSTDSIYMRYKKQYSPHYFGSGFYGSSEREAALLVSAALDRADKTQVSKSLDEIKFEKDTKRDITKIFSLSSRSGKIRSLEETTEPMIKYMFLLKGIEYNGFSDAIALIKSGKLADMGITPDMNYVDVADLIHYELMEVLQARAESMAELDDSVNGIENPVALARALREVKDAYKDREFTNRTKTRFFKTFEEAFVVSGRRPRNMGAADAVFKYAGDIKTATKNRIILNQMVQVTDIEGHALIIPEPNLETKLTDKEQVLTPEAWTIVADRMAAWFHDSVDPKATMQENVERMIQKYVVRSKSYARVDSAYDSTPAFYAFKQDLGKDTVLDVLAGGEVAGILKHVISKPWQDPWGILNALDHLNQWMKICSLQFSLFFQMAGQEGLIAVMGHKYFTSEGGPFHTQVEWRRMLKMGHPYVLKMIADAEAIGLRFGSVANPMGLPSGMYESDIAALTDYTEKHIGKKAAGRVKAILSFSKKQSDFMFETYYNTIKLWTVYMYSNLLEAKATKAGVPYDFKEAMLPHVDYINSEVGGVNWNKYSWMTPSWKRFWSLDQFSPDWGMSAWNAAGGGLLTAQFLKNFMTPDELKFITTHRWPQMFLYVMLMVPLMVQATAFVIGKAAGTVGDDDEWLIFNNEEGRKLHANLTPLLKAIHKIPGMPAYEGFPTGERKAYIRWGKQAYETQRWLESPWNSLMSKSSQIVRWAVEQATGTSGGSVNFPLPFKDQGFIGLFQGKDGDFMGSRIGYTLQKFAPFSILAYAQNKDAAPFQILGPVTKGMGFYTAVKAYTGLLDTWARDTTYANIYRSPHVKANLESLGQSILDAAEANGYEPAKVITAAKGAVLKDYYAGLYKAINANDSVATEKWARCIIRLNGTIQSTLSSARNRNEMYGKPEKLSDDQRRMIREAFGQ